MVVMSNAALEDDGVPDIKSMLTVGSPDRLNPAEGNQKFVRWERFLPKRSLRVLLVEHDDSTRHIVAALLRKCSYHVSAVGDGRKAWEVLKEKGYNFDLVLTEFEMPLLSGIVLLSKIVGSESCKNIPVIMMSSKDSVGIVHKCMLKGAVDFLVKPLRKNELRNLWQHVWRRHWSASYTCASENSIASNQFSSNASERSQADENSGKGDDDQSLDNKLNTNLVIFQKLDEILAKQSQSPNAEAHPVQPRNSMTTVLCSSVIEANGLLTDKTLVVGDATFLPNQVTSLIESNRANELDLIRCSEGDEKSNLLRQLNFHAAMKTTITEENVFSGAATCSQMKHVSSSSTLPPWDLSSSTQVIGSVEHHAKKQNILNHSSASAFTRYAGTYTKMVYQKENLPSACIGYNNCMNQQQSHVSYHGNVNLNCLLSPSRVPCQRFYIEDEAQLQPINYQDNTLISQRLAATENDTKAEEQGGLLRAFREEEYGSSTCKNMLKDSGSIVTGEKTDAVAATGTALQKRIESCIQNFDKKVTNSYRENALIKFRMKRKDRCFEKKVRYHNRKKLAEQRPRVKGQFVREKVLRSQ